MLHIKPYQSHKCRVCIHRYKTSVSFIDDNHDHNHIEKEKCAACMGADCTTIDECRQFKLDEED